MSTTIENRIVEMRFDNDQFEKEVKTSLSTMDKLKQALDFKGATKGLETVANAGKAFNLSGVSMAVTTVMEKFSAFEQMAIGALRNIGARAVDTGTQLLKGLSVDNIAGGWQKYIDKTSSVQAIMNATGKSIDEVNGYLNQLMWYSDETSFGFTDMTQALAQMTSTGGEIENIIPLLMGVGNATAFAGKGATEFQRSIYNLSQSYGTGFLNLMDWKSLENAGTASKQLKEALIDAGIAIGTIKEGEVTIENFRDSLKDQWATKEVMEQAFGTFAERTQQAYELVESGQFALASEAYDYLSQYYDDYGMKAAKAAQEAKSWEEAIDSVKDAVSSGWMNSFEQIFGNYEEGKTVWTWWANTLWDVFNGGAEFRNNVLAGWKEAGGREENIYSILNLWNGISETVTTVKDAVAKVFGLDKSQEEWVKILIDISNAFYRWTYAIYPTEEELSALWDTAFKVSVVVKRLGNVVKNALSKAFGYASSAIDIAKQAIDEFLPDDLFKRALDFVDTLSDIVDSFQLGDGAANGLKSTFKGLLAVVDLVAQAFGAFITVFGKDIATAVSFVATKFLEFTGRIGDFLVGVDDSARKSEFFKEKLTALRDILVRVGTAVYNAFITVKTAITNVINQLKESEEFNKFVDKLKECKDWLIEIAGVALDSAITTIGSWFTELGNHLPTAEEVAGALETIMGHIENFITMLQNQDYSSVGEFFNSLFSGGEGVSDSNILSTIVETVKNIIKDVFSDEGVLDTAKTQAAGIVTKVIEGIKEVFEENFGDTTVFDILEALNLAAMLRIALAIGDFFGGIADAAEGVGKIPSAVVGVLNTLRTTIASYQAQINATTLLKIAAAMVLFVGAIAGLSFIPAEQLSTSVAALVIVMGMLTIVANAIGKMFDSKSGLDGLSLFAANLSQGLKSLLSGAGWALRLASFGGAFLAVAISLGAIVGVIYALAKMIQTNGPLIGDSLDILVRIFSGISLVLVSVASFPTINYKSIAAMGSSFLAIGVAMAAIAVAIKIIAGIKGDVNRAIAPLSTLSACIAIVMALFGMVDINESQVDSMGKTFLKISASLIIIAAALKIVATIDTPKIMRSAGALGFALAALVVGLAVINYIDVSQSAIKAMLSAAAALLVISAAVSLIALSGADWKQFGILMLSFVLGLGLLIGAAALVGNFSPIAVGLTAIGAAVLMLGSAVLAAGVGVLAFAAGINLLSNNSEAVPGIMINIATGIIEFGNIVKNNITSLLAFGAAMIVLSAAAAAVAIAAGVVVAAFIILGAVVAKVLTQIGTGISVGGAAIIAGIATLLVIILAFIVDSVPGFVDGILKTIIIVINTISLAILENTGPLYEAVGLLIASIGRMMILGLAGLVAGFLEALGLTDLATKVKDAADSWLGPDSSAANAIRANNAELREQVKTDFTSIGNAAAEGLASAEKPDYGELGPNEGDTANMTRAGADMGTAFTTEYVKNVEGASTPEVAKGLTTEDAKAEQRAAAKTLSDEYNSAYESEMNAAADSSGYEWVDRLKGSSRQKYYDAGVESAGVYRRGEGLGFDSPLYTDPTEQLRSFDYESLGLEQGMDFSSGVSSGMDGSSWMVSGSADALSLEALSGMSGNLDMASLVGGDYASMFGTGFTNSYPSVEQTATGLSDSAVSGLSVNTEAATTAGQDMATAFADGMSNNETAISDAAAAISDTASGAFDDAYDTAFASGSSISFGFGAGMYSNRTAVTDAASIISDEVASKFDSGSTTSFNAGVTLSTQFAAGVSSKQSTILTNVSNMMKQILKTMDSGQASARNHGVSLITSFASGIQSSASRPAFNAASVLRSALSVLGTGGNSAYQSGSLLALSLANGISAGYYTVGNAAYTLVRAAANYTSGSYNYGYNAGANFSLGMGRGISAYAYAAASAAASVAARAAAAARARLKIASPSRVAAEIGMYFDLGFAKGLNQYSGKVSDAAEDGSSNVIDSFSAIVSRIKDVLDGTIDIDPTIRPVLDLSAIQNGANQLNGMLSGSYSYAANAIGGLNSISNTDQILNGLNSLAAKLGNTRQLPNINITVNAGNVDDPDELAEIISDRIQFKYAQIGASLGG